MYVPLVLHGKGQVQVVLFGFKSLKFQGNMTAKKRVIPRWIKTSSCLAIAHRTLVSSGKLIGLKSALRAERRNTMKFALFCIVLIVSTVALTAGIVFVANLI